ncbi:MAG: AAA family ATPase, partial [Clostridia bacterium]|nr:AAA family ATPase [Clostridia bacterium]
MIRQITKISQVTPEVTFFLRELGFSNYYIVKIFAVYGDATISLVEDNPYFLLEDFPKIGFRKMDEIAQKLKISMDDEKRIEAGINYVLSSYAQEGHTYASFDSFSLKVGEFLNVSSKQVKNCVTDMAFLGNIQLTKIDDETVICFYPYYRAECEVAKRLVQLNSNQNLFRVIGNFKEKIDQFCALRNIDLSENQRLAAVSAIGNAVSIITGGPGTGKSTVIEAIVHIFEASGMKVALVAPTGRAAKRIMETSHHFAQTVHRLLGYYYDDALDRMLFSMN